MADVKKLSPPNPDRVTLDTQYYIKEDAKNPGKKGEAAQGEHVYVNPFLRARLATNPTVRKERPAEWDKMDVASLRHMNSEEPYNLLQCRKHYTLAIKEFAIPAMLQDRNLNRSGGLLANIGIGKGTYSDVSAENAHGLAEGAAQGEVGGSTCCIRSTPALSPSAASTAPMIRRSARCRACWRRASRTIICGCWSCSRVRCRCRFHTQRVRE